MVQLEVVYTIHIPILFWKKSYQLSRHCDCSPKVIIISSKLVYDMGIIQSKADAFEEKKHTREEAALGSPSKTMGKFDIRAFVMHRVSHYLISHSRVCICKSFIDASEYCQELVYQISKLIESDLGMLPVPGMYRSL